MARRALIGLGLVVLLSGCAGAMAEKEPLSAGAALKDKDGKDVGTATLIQTPDGLRIAVTGYRLPPGAHGLHIHAVGDCQPPDFTSAGAHFNPAGKQHGRLNPAGAHAGDLPNLAVAASGEGGIDIVTTVVTLEVGPNSLLGGKGTSVVIHAAPDDEKTDPTGNSGARIACGVIAK
jgi:Cu-Zn family superoxide dismutase